MRIHTTSQDKYMQQVKCYPCNKQSVMTHEYIQQIKCQEK